MLRFDADVYLFENARCVFNPFIMVVVLWVASAHTFARLRVLTPQSSSTLSTLEINSSRDEPLAALKAAQFPRLLGLG